MTHRYRLYPAKARVSVLERTLGVCRDVYNSPVHERTVLYETIGKAPSRVDPCHKIATWKPSHPELADAYSQVLQNITRCVDLAFQALFRRVKDGEKTGYPRLKGRGQYDSITCPWSGFGFYQGRLHLSKISDAAIHLRTHKCLSCGLVLDRDTNTPVNILAAVGQHSLATLAA